MYSRHSQIHLLLATFLIRYFTILSDISTTWGSHCSLGVHFYFTFSSQGLPTQMLTLPIFLQGFPLKSWQKSPWLHNSCIVNVCKSNITWIIPRFSIRLKSSQTPLRYGWRREVWWNNILGSPVLLRNLDGAS